MIEFHLYVSHQIISQLDREHTKLVSRKKFSPQNNLADLKSNNCHATIPLKVWALLLSWESFQLYLPWVEDNSLFILLIKVTPESQKSRKETISKQGRVGRVKHSWGFKFQDKKWKGVIASDFCGSSLGVGVGGVRLYQVKERGSGDSQCTTTL